MMMIIYVLLVPLKIIHASLIVNLSLLIIRKHLIGPINLLKLLSRLLVTLILIRMVPHRQSPKSLLYFRFGGLGRNFQYLVEIINLSVAGYAA